MSWRTLNAVIDRSETTASQRLLMLVIADGTSKDTDVYFANPDTLAFQCRCTIRWVQKLIPPLIKAGELIAYRTESHRAGRPGWTAFRIPIYEGEPGYSPEPCNNSDHICNGYHTPLSVSREEAMREELQRARKAARNARPRGPKRIVDKAALYPRSQT